VCIGLIVVRIQPWYEAFFFVSVISYLMIYLLMLIRDLDNPFGYYEHASGVDVSLKPLEDAAGGWRSSPAPRAPGTARNRAQRRRSGSSAECASFWTLHPRPGLIGSRKQRRFHPDSHGVYRTGLSVSLFGSSLTGDACGL